MAGSEVLLTFSPAGICTCLHTELIDLEEIGKITEIRRASDIEFSPQIREWEVEIDGRVCFSDRSRVVCLEWERQYFERKRME